jgi:hypothetical protein
MISHLYGCCIDPLTGETSRDVQVKNYFAALVAVGIFGGFGLSVPAKSRSQNFTFLGLVCSLVPGLCRHTIRGIQ